MSQATPDFAGAAGAAPGPDAAGAVAPQAGAAPDVSQIDLSSPDLLRNLRITEFDFAGNPTAYEFMGQAGQAAPGTVETPAPEVPAQPVAPQAPERIDLTTIPEFRQVQSKWDSQMAQQQAENRQLRAQVQQLMQAQAQGQQQAHADARLQQALAQAKTPLEQEQVKLQFQAEQVQQREAALEQRQALREDIQALKDNEQVYTRQYRIPEQVVADATHLTVNEVKGLVQGGQIQPDEAPFYIHSLRHARLDTWYRNQQAYAAQQRQQPAPQPQAPAPQAQQQPAQQVPAPQWVATPQSTAPAIVSPDALLQRARQTNRPEDWAAFKNFINMPVR